MGSSKVTYPEGAYYRFQKVLAPTVIAVDASGYPVISENVTMTWLSGAWNDSTGNNQRKQTLTTDNNGRAVFNLEVPTSLGTHSYLIPGAIVFRDYYDIDGLLFTSEGTNEKMIVYHFLRSDYVHN